MSAGLFVPDLNDLLAFGAAGFLTTLFFGPHCDLVGLSGPHFDLEGLAVLFGPHFDLEVVVDLAVDPGLLGLHCDLEVVFLVVALYLGVEVFFALGFDDTEETFIGPVRLLAVVFFLLTTPIGPERLLGFFLLLLLFVFL